MDIGNAIKQIRKQKGISQETLAFDADLSRHYMYKVENNLASPTIKTLEKIGGVLNTKVSEIIKVAEDSGYPPPHK